MALAVVFLAAGKGRRMVSDLPKVLHEVAGAPLIWHAHNSAEPLNPDRTVVVAGHGADQVRGRLSDFGIAADIVLQRDQLGTGHAAETGLEGLNDFDGDVLILYGDSPFIRTSTLEGLVRTRRGGADLAFLAFEADDPAGYGRVLRDENGRPRRIVETRNAGAEELKVALCFGGALCADRATLSRLLQRVGPDSLSGERYLTEVVGLAAAAGLECAFSECAESETLGVNSRQQLCDAEAVYQEAARKRAIESGARLLSPETVYFSFDTALAKEATIEPNVYFGPGVSVGSGTRVRAFSHLEGCEVGSGCSVGPFARLRPGARIEQDAFIGNFVEIKASSIGEGSKVRHLSFIGDASVGSRTNIGAGTITCNYDGVAKHPTSIGDQVFIGSDTILVAPVQVGDRAMTAAGSTVTADVPDGALAVARSRQENKLGYAGRILSRLRSAAGG